MEMQFRINQFEGPLDLLLSLISKAEIRIEDIFISDITEQYLQMMQGLDMDMEAASEFLAMAATLLEIKSRSLLPKPPPLTEEEDPEEALIRRLKDYRLFKAAGNGLQALGEKNAGRYYKLPEELHFSEKLELEKMTMQQLLDAFSEAMNRYVQKKLPPAVREIRRDLFTIKDKVQHIRRRLSAARSLTFGGLFEENATRGEIVVTFIALLELWKNRFVRLTQADAQSEILLERLDAG